MLADSAAGLVKLFRSEVDDNVIDQGGGDQAQLWKDWELYAYLTEACDALLKGTGRMYKTLRLPFVVGQAIVPLPASVLHIREGRLVGRGTPVELRNANERHNPAERDYGLGGVEHDAMFASQGTPCSMVRDYENKALRLLPIPNAPDTLELQCTATIGAPIDPNGFLPTHDAEEQRLLLCYMKARAYEKQDAETEDLVRAGKHQKQFDAGAMIRESRLRSYRRRAGVVRMEW